MTGPSPPFLILSVETNFQLLGKVEEVCGDGSSRWRRPQEEDTTAYDWVACVHTHTKEAYLEKGSTREALLSKPTDYPTTERHPCLNQLISQQQRHSCPNQLISQQQRDTPVQANRFAKNNMKIEVEIWMEFQLMKGSSSNPGEESKYLLRRIVLITSPHFQH